MTSDSKLLRLITNAIRRVAVRVSGARFWQVDGFSGESFEAPVFAGVGFYSRPPEGSTAAEAVVLKIQGNSDLPVIVATHDEDMRRAHDEVRDIGAGETAIFSSGAFIRLTRDGDVIIRAGAGREVLIDDGAGAQALATKADLDAHIGVYNAHTHLYNPGPGSPVATVVPVTLDTPKPGTQVLKGK